MGVKRDIFPSFSIIRLVLLGMAFNQPQTNFRVHFVNLHAYLRESGDRFAEW